MRTIFIFFGFGSLVVVSGGNTNMWKQSLLGSSKKFFFFNKLFAQCSMVPISRCHTNCTLNREHAPQLFIPCDLNAILTEVLFLLMLPYATDWTYFHWSSACLSSGCKEFFRWEVEAHHRPWKYIFTMFVMHLNIKTDVSVLNISVVWFFCFHRKEFGFPILDETIYECCTGSIPGIWSMHAFSGLTLTLTWGIGGVTLSNIENIK